MLQHQVALTFTQRLELVGYSSLRRKQQQCLERLPCSRARNKEGNNYIPDLHFDFDVDVDTDRRSIHLTKEIGVAKTTPTP